MTPTISITPTQGAVSVSNQITADFNRVVRILARIANAIANGVPANPTTGAPAITGAAIVAQLGSNATVIQAAIAAVGITAPAAITAPTISAPTTNS